MKNLTMFCLTLEPNHLLLIKKLNYVPVGLGDAKFSSEWLHDKSGQSIAEKNSNYGEYTFHYWLWKNYLDNINSEWVGFCQYRKFFIHEAINEKDVLFDTLNNKVIKSLSTLSSSYDCILGEKSFVNNYRLKFFKKNLIKILKTPSVIFSKKNRNIKFHFDVFHGEGNLDAAVDLLDEDNKENFRKFVNEETSFNPHNMFICKKEILHQYYESVFPWLKKCENIFGFNNLKGYGLKRIYGFLAERYLSYWFQKNKRVKEYPILFKDISDYKDF